MNVPDIAEAIENTRKLLESKGGYVVSMNNSFLEVRVPVDHFDAFCKELQGVGTIVNHFMSSSDVTQQMTDTESRIAALELLKKRLHEIAQKAVTVEDMLQVERELNRVIGELEELKKNMKNFTLQTDYCLVRINFAAQIQAPAPIKQIPVAWMNQYGVNLLSDGWIRTGGDHYKPYKIDLPQNFMITGSRLKNDSSFLTAVSPDGSVIRLSSHANMKGGTLDYYAELAKRYFTDYQNLKIQSFELERIGEKRQAFVMKAERKEAGKQTLYYYWVCFMDKDRLLSFDEGKVYCFEYQCDDPEVWNKTLPEIKQCLQTLNLSVWR